MVHHLPFSPSIKTPPQGPELMVELELPSETQDVVVMDTLLNAVRARSNPAYHNITPMRNLKCMLWSETLLSSSAPLEATYHAAPTPSQESLPPRSMHDTYTQIILPFKSSPELLEQYTNVYGSIRIGMLMEHLDSLAGSVSYKHLLGPDVEMLGRSSERGFYVVTASADRLDMLAPLYPVRDTCLSGQVVYTGTSSIEVAVKIEALCPDGNDETLMLGRFSMVCRDARTHKAYPVNPLVVGTAEEQALYCMGKNAQNRRRSLALQSFPPLSSEEAEELYQTFLKCGRVDLLYSLQSDQVWMGDTKIEKTIIMFPQERNVHHKVFGGTQSLLFLVGSAEKVEKQGYLMRLATELGFANACLFTKSRVLFHSLDSVSFRKPVNIGSILRLESQVLNTSRLGELPVRVHIRVQANVIDVKTSLEDTTSDFRLTFAIIDDDHHDTPRVIPRTYQEVMLWLEGKRKLEIGRQVRARQCLV